MKRARCRSCGAFIVWAKSEAGKWLPFDFEPHPRGTFILTEDFDATEPKAFPWRKFDQALLPLYRERWVPHWATCPQANAHRRTS